MDILEKHSGLTKASRSKITCILYSLLMYSVIYVFIKNFCLFYDAINYCLTHLTVFKGVQQTLLKFVYDYWIWFEKVNLS